MIEVVVVGGGPSGLALGILLAQAGRSVRVLETRTVVDGHSRAIGIHPPGLDVLHRLGVGAAAVASGVAIRRGVGISRGMVVAELGFDTVASPHPYVLSLPQSQTLGLLRERLAAIDPSALLEGYEFERHSARPGSYVVHARERDGTHRSLECRFLIGADGTHSAVRRSALVPFPGRGLTDGYVMGDFSDDTEFGSTAALFLHRDGITESFPLPGHKRRWVCRVEANDSTSLPELIWRRTGQHVDERNNTMLSRFPTAEHHVHAMNHGNLVLIGDAAHQISPIGGQGMTLGLLDALGLAPILTAALAGQISGSGLHHRLDAFSQRRLIAARHAGRAARLNMILGRGLGPVAGAGRDALARALFAVDPLSSRIATAFTMTNSKELKKLEQVPCA